MNTKTINKPVTHIRYMINSNYRFYQTSLPILLPSLLKNQIPAEDIHVTIGGSPLDKVETHEGITYHFVQYDSIDYSGLITIARKALAADYWFYLHDTTKAGNKFKMKLERRVHALTASGMIDKIALRKDSSMNIGVYHFSYLMQEKDRLISLINHDLSEASLQKIKAWGIHNEDYLLKPITHSLTQLKKRDFVTIDECDYYSTGSVRRVEYYPSIDLLKIKANWDPQNEYSLKL